MKITLLTYGSRGDVQPFLALALGLQQAGHQPTLAAPARFEAFIRSYNIAFIALPGDPAELSQRFNQAGQNPIRMVTGMMDHAMQIAADMLRQTETACQGADLIVHTFAHVLGAHALASRLGVPDVCIQPFPMFAPTGDYPNVTLPGTPIRPLNRLTHTFSSLVMEWGGRLGYGLVRRRERLPGMHLPWPFRARPGRQATPLLFAWSPSLLPASRDWPPYARVTGYLFMPEESYHPPRELDTFLQSGPPPVCISFGSMLHKDASRIYQVLLGVLAEAGERVILLSGWGDAPHDLLTQNTLLLDSAPHSWLLPRCKLVIHHGGAGTTAAGLQAGIPNIVIPHIADQPFWGRRVRAVGAGPQPILVNQVTSSRIRTALAEAESESVGAAAAKIGRAIRAENGLGDTISFLEAYSVRWRAG